MRKVILMDTETYPNFFLVGLMNYLTGEKFSFEISPLKDDREEIYEYFRNFNDFLVSFNGIYYDNILLSYFLKDWKIIKKLSKRQLLDNLQELSNKAIDSDAFFETLKPYIYFHKPWIDIDLMLYWSKQLRLSKKISLKGLGIQLDYPVVQELPYAPGTVLTQNQIDDVKVYNLEHDLGILKLLTDSKKDEIKLREYIYNTYELECYSMDAPKIASEILLKEYVKKTVEERDWDAAIYEFRRNRFSPYYGLIGPLIKNIPFDFKNPTLKKVYEEVLISDRTFSKEFILIKDKTALNISLGIGGIHSIHDNDSYSAKKDELYISSDVASLYPTLIINYGLIRFKEVLEIYQEVKNDRIIAKKNKEKSKDAILKLILNSCSGLLDNQYSWLYYPEGALKLRILGQLLMLLAVDRCLDKGIRVIALNTDSIDVILKKEDEQTYYNIINEISSKYNVVFEHDFLQWTKYANINAYIQQTLEGKVKRKGFFKLKKDEKGKSEIPLGDSVNEMVIPKALTNYFIHNISPEETIYNPEKYGLSILDYCRSDKVSKNYTVWYNNQTQQNLNRYYFSSPAPYLFKQKEGKSTMEHMNVGNSVLLYNRHKSIPFSEYNVNYTYYINKVKTIIDKLEPKQLTLF